MQERVYKRGEIYWCWYYNARGRRVRRSTKCRDKRAAYAVLARFEREAQSAAATARDSTPYTVDDAVNAFVEEGTIDLAPQTVRFYIEKGSQLLRLLGAVDLVLLQLQDVERYIKQRLKEGASRATVRHELVALRQSLKHAHERGRYVGDLRALFPRFRSRYVPRTRYLTPDEFRKLIGVLQPHRQLWLVLAVYTGGRDSEVDAVLWEHVNWAERTVLLPGTKTAKSRRLVPLHPLLSQVLARGRRASGVIVGEWLNVRRDLAAACARAGIDKVSPNDLRRTYASWLKQAGVDSAVVARLLGHSSTRMVDMVYGQIDGGTLARALNMLPGGDCDNGVPHSNAPTGPGGRAGHPQLTGTSVSAVLGAGIEPATRGFSVRESSGPDARIDRMLSAGAQGDCDNGARAVDGAPRLRVVTGDRR